MNLVKKQKKVIQFLNFVKFDVLNLQKINQNNLKLSFYEKNYFSDTVVFTDRSGILAIHRKFRERYSNRLGSI